MSESKEVEEEADSAVLVRETVRLTEAQYKALEELARVTNSGPRRGANYLARSWRSMLRRIAIGEVEVRETEKARREREAWEAEVEKKRAERAAGKGRPRGPKPKSEV